MHELGIALEIHRTCREAMAPHPGARIERVTVAVGELTAVEPDLLESAWEAAVAGSPDEGSEIRILWRPARQYCAGCRADKPRAEGSWLRLCPDCGMPLAVEGGEELDVLELAFIEPDGEDTDG